MAHTWWHIWDGIETRSDKGLAKDPNIPIGTGYVEAKRQFIQNIPIVGDYSKMVERNQQFMQQQYQRREEEGGLGNWLLNRYADIPRVMGQALASPITVPSKLFNIHPEVTGDVLGVASLGKLKVIPKGSKFYRGVQSMKQPKSPWRKGSIDVDAFDPSTRIDPLTSSSINRYAALQKRGSTRFKSELEALKVEQGGTSSSVLAYSGTGERISAITKKPSPYIYQEGSKFLPGQKISDSFALRTQISNQLLDLLADQKERGITVHSKGEALKEFQKLRRNLAIETTTGDPKRINNLTQAVEAIEAGEQNSKVIADIIQFGAKGGTQAQAEGILLRTPPDDELRVYVAASYPQLSAVQVDEIVELHSLEARKSFAQVQEVSRQLSLSRKDWLEEYLTGKKIAKADREIIKSILKDAGHFMAAKSLVVHPEHARLTKLLKSKGVDIKRLSRRATSGETAWPETRLGPEGNIAGKNKPEHEMNIHLAKLMHIPTNWAESIDLTIDRYLGLNKKFSWKEIYSRDQLVKAMELRHDADEALAKAYFDKEIKPMTNYRQLSEGIDVWADQFGISRRGERTMMYESDFPYARDTYTPVKDEGGAMTKAEAKAYDREMAEKRRKKKK